MRRTTIVAHTAGVMSIMDKVASITFIRSHSAGLMTLKTLCFVAEAAIPQSATVQHLIFDGASLSRTLNFKESSAVVKQGILTRLACSSALIRYMSFTTKDMVRSNDPPAT